MKIRQLPLLTAVFFIAFLFAGCEKEKSGELLDITTEVTGTYHGLVTPSNNANDSKAAIMDVTRVDEHSVQLTMTSEHFDTSFMLNLYVYGDSIMVCFTGDRFFEEYGYHLDEEHHLNGNDLGWSWQHHLVEQHFEGDKHYGGFDTKSHTFSYEIVPADKLGVTYQFTGSKD